MADNPNIIDVNALRSSAPVSNFDQKTLEMLLQLQLNEQTEKIAERVAAKERAQQSKAEMRAAIETQNRMRREAQARCNHTLPRGENAVSGQVHNDGKFHGLCVVCLKQFTPTTPRGEQIQSLAEMA